MNKIIVLVVSMAFLLSAPVAMARGGASYRATIDRIARKDQKCQKQMDKKLYKIQKEAEREISEMYRNSK